MYLYLYDSFLNTPKYRRVLARIEMRLTDLGIGGKISRLSPLKNIKELIKDEIKNGVNTVVAVGGDKTVIQIVNDIAEHDVTMGIIPVGGENKIAKALGVPPAEEACPILAARKLEKLDLGSVNKSYFLLGLHISSGRVTLECEDSYEIRPLSDAHSVTICNLRPSFASINFGHRFNPCDGFMEALITPTENFLQGIKKIFGLKAHAQRSIVPLKKVFIRSKHSETVIGDGEKKFKTPLYVEVVPKKLSVIVGKQRMF